MKQRKAVSFLVIPHRGCQQEQFLSTKHMRAKRFCSCLCGNAPGIGSRICFPQFFQLFLQRLLQSNLPEHFFPLRNLYIFGNSASIFHPLKVRLFLPLNLFIDQITCRQFCQLPLDFSNSCFIRFIHSEFLQNKDNTG